jgi:hypothetical protein
MEEQRDELGHFAPMQNGMAPLPHIPRPLLEREPTSGSRTLYHATSLEIAKEIVGPQTCCVRFRADSQPWHCSHLASERDVF